MVSASDGDFLWAGLGLAGVAVTTVPALAYRDWTAALPWEVSLVAAVPYALKAFDLLLSRPVAAFLVAVWGAAYPSGSPDRRPSGWTTEKRRGPREPRRRRRWRRRRDHPPLNL